MDAGAAVLVGRHGNVGLKGGDPMSNRVKGARTAVNREISMSTIINQLPDLSDRELVMVADYIRGLRAADIFLSR